MAQNTTSAQDRIIDGASAAPSMDDLLAIIDDLDGRLSEALKELEDAKKTIEELQATDG